MASKVATLVERTAELELLDRIMRTCESSVIIEGPAGIGKTALLAAAVRTAPHDTTVRGTQCSLLEQGLSGAVVLDLLGALVDDADDAVFDGGAAGARALFEPLGRTLPEGLALFHALHSLCVNLSRGRRLILAIDDAQWADTVSLEFLAYLVRRAAGTPVAVIMTVRAGEPGALRRLLAEVGDIPDVVTIRPQALSRAGAADVVSDVLAHDASVEVTQEWWRQSGGVPLFLLELARRHRLGDSTSTPDSVVRLVQSRLEHLPRQARQVAVGLSVLGAAGRPHEVASLVDLEMLDVLGHVDHLDRVELVDAETLSFIHPLLGEAVLAGVPSGELTGLRVRAAQILHEDHPLRAAAQLAALGPSVCTGAEWAARTLFAASTRAMERGGLVEAVHYLQRAAQEPADNALRFRVLLDLGRFKAQLRDPEALRDFDQATTLAAGPLERARTALLHGEALFHFGELDHCSRVCLAAVAELGREHRELALQLHAMAFNADGVTGSRRDRASAFVDDVGLASSPGERAVSVHVVADAAARGTWTAADVRAAGRRALGDGALLAEVGAASPTYIFCGTALAWADDFDTVITLSERGLECGERRGSRMAIAYASALHAGVLLRAGRLKDAEQSAARVVDELADADPMSYGIAVGWLVQTLVEQGRVAEARHILDSSGLGGSLPSLGTVAFLMLARGYLYLAEGNATAADAEFVTVGEIAQASLYPNPAALAWRSGRARALLALGRRDEAERLAVVEVDLSRDFGAGRALAIALHVQAACAVEPDVQMLLLREAADQAESAGALLEHTRALVDLGRLQMDAGDPAARQTLEIAMDLADRCGAETWGDTAKALLVDTGARPRRRRIHGVESLTRQERRTVLLAAAGKLNREIADDLFISLGTVETHLTNAYRKLGVTSRSELADLPALHPGDDEHVALDQVT